jgi:hypothetical protein
MKVSIVCALVAVISATNASAYSLSPPDTTARLRGNLTFTPNNGSGTQPFTCKITLYLQTKGVIKGVAIDGPGNCNFVLFEELPWRIVITDSNAGVFGEVKYSSNLGNCSQFTEDFQVNSSGVWTLAPGQCMSGTLTSHPAVTIVP